MLRRQRVVARRVQARQVAQVNSRFVARRCGRRTGARVHRRWLRRREIEAGIAHAARHVAQHVPVGARFAGHRQKGALARDAALGIGHRAILFTPAQGRQQHVGMGVRVRAGADVGHHHQFALGQRAAHLVGVRHADQRIGGDDPQGFDLARLDGVEQLHRVQAGLVGHARRVPEGLHGFPVRRLVEVQVRRQHVGQATHFAPAHGVRLAREGKRSHAGLADAPRRQVTVDDAVDLVGAGRRLIDTLRKAVTTLRVAANAW